MRALREEARHQARREHARTAAFYLKQEEECLAACGGAPMMVVNGHYHEHLTTEKVDEILDELK